MSVAPGPAWWRRPVLVDGALAAFLFAISTPTWASTGDLARLPLSLALTAPLVLRRRYPVQVFAVVTLAAFVQWLTTPRIGAYDLAVVAALYSISAYASRRWSAPALGVGLLGAVLAWLSVRSTRDVSYLGLIPPAAVVVAAWLAGQNMRTRRRYLAELEQRASRLEREREALARAAVAEERARIAREMHDVVAHTVAVMVAQAEGARATVRTAPERAEAAMVEVCDAGRTALGELRRMVGVLREEGDSTGTAPQPDARDLDALVASMRASGLPVRLVREGAHLPLEPTMGLAVYRIVQESLTNTLKHCGPQTPTDVVLRRTADRVEVEVVDRGAVGHPPAARDLAGHGLSGMRERVAMFAGVISAGPTATGGWRVHAVLPTGGAAS